VFTSALDVLDRLVLSPSWPLSSSAQCFVTRCIFGMSSSSTYVSMFQIYQAETCFGLTNESHYELLRLEMNGPTETVSSWEDNIKTNLNETGWINFAQDRKKW
jgi:hypothetical protein